MNRLSRGTILVIGGALCASVALGGCSAIQSQSYIGKAAIQTDGASIHIKLCEPISAGHIRLAEVAKQGDDLKGLEGTFFSARGAAKLRNGSEFTTHLPPDGMVVTASATPKLRTGDLIILHVDDRTLQASFTITKHGLPTDTWLRSDGTDSKTPCDGGFFGS